MVKVTIAGDRLHLDVQAWDQLWALRSHLDIPLAHVLSVDSDPEAARGWWHGFKVAGSQIPGLMTAGTFYEHGGIVFYDVHHPENTIVLELDHERYKRLIIEVDDPSAAVKTISEAIRRPRG
jgi:hypothetical protein